MLRNYKILAQQHDILQKSSDSDIIMQLINHYYLSQLKEK